jgi:hypothetical protein
VHEATFSAEEPEKADLTGHSTAADAAGIARDAGVRRLILTHISARYTREAPELLAEAQAIFPASMVARDGLIVDVPFPDAEALRLPAPRTGFLWRFRGGGGAHLVRVAPHAAYLAAGWHRLIGVPVLPATGGGFRGAAFTLAAVHARILVGVHTRRCGRVLGRDALGLARNHYDRFGHFAGFVPPSWPGNLVRTSPPAQPVASCGRLAWPSALLLDDRVVDCGAGGASSTAFFSGGRHLDTQWDMFLALIGAASALLVLSRAHDRQLARLLPGR